MYRDSADKAFGVLLPSTLERYFSRGKYFSRLAVMQGTWGQQANATVIIFMAVPIKEVTAEGQGVLAAAEAFGKVREVFQCFELALGERVVIGNVRPA